MHLAFEKDIVLESSNLLLKPITLSDIDNLLYISTSDKTLI